MYRVQRRLWRLWHWAKWRLLLLAILSFCLWLLFGPTVSWYLRASLPLELLVVNYTMPLEDDRKHRGLFWLLHHLKVQAPPGQSHWKALRDYIGYRPALPPSAAERLSQHKRRRPQVLYLSDTYGVYRDDLINKKRWLAPEWIDRSPKVFGGVDHRDAGLIRRWVGQGTHLFVEFNSMCEPTQEGARHILSSLVGVAWTGWVGKVFANPKDPQETPRWLPRDFKRQYPYTPFPTQPTLFLVHHKGGLVYISGKKVFDVAPVLLQTDLGKQRFPHVQTPTTYTFWFAVVSPSDPKTQVYTSFRLPQHPRFQKMLHHGKIPPVFPAITERKCSSQSRCFYMAADFSDANFDPGGYRRTDITTLRRWITPLRTSNAVASFWLVYVPTMMTLFPELSRPHTVSSPSRSGAK